MSAYTGPEALLRLTELFQRAYDLIKSEQREWYETKSLFAALQGYKDKTLGWVEPKLSRETYEAMFWGALGGSRKEYERLMDSLCEFGVSENTIRDLKSKGPLTLPELFQMELRNFCQLVGSHPNEHVIGHAFHRIQLKIGIENPLYSPIVSAEEQTRLAHLLEMAARPAHDQ